MTTNRRQLLAVLAAGIVLPRWAYAAAAYPVTLPDAEWRRRLPAAAYDVLRHEGTEPPYSSPLNNEHRKGTFACRGCDNPLYASTTKFDSGTGWPSFWQPLPHAIGTVSDHELIE